MDSTSRAQLVDLLESSLSDEQARIGDGALLAGTELAEALADALIHAGVIMVHRTVTQSDEERIREALAEAQEHPGRIVIR